MGVTYASICKSSGGRQKESENFIKTRKYFLTRRSDYDTIIQLRDERLSLERDEHKKEFEKLENSS